jgi:hypothetical protein
VQVDKQLPVRVALCNPVSGVHRQRGFADPGHPVDRADDNRCWGVFGIGHEPKQSFDLYRTPGERRRVSRKLPRLRQPIQADSIHR